MESTKVISGVTFNVSDVEPRDSPFKFYEYQKRDLAETLKRHEILDQHKYPHRTLLHATSKPGTISAQFNNGFVSAALGAYNNHWNLAIRPDDIWICITQNFAKYMEKEGEALRKKFVAFEGKMELIAYGGGTIHSANWEDLFRQICDLIEKNTVSDVRGWLEPNFSTTTPHDKMVGRVVLMAALQKFFSYGCTLMCGIPYVTLEGTLEDWKNIRSRIEKLKDYGLEDWSLILLDIIDQFIESYQGNVDEDFWNRICSIEGRGSGPRYICGWLNAFIAFDSDGNYLINKYQKVKESNDYGRIETGDIPVGAVQVPFKVDDNGTVYNTILYAGFITSNFDQATGTIRPQVDWAMIDDTQK